LREANKHSRGIRDPPAHGREALGGIFFSFGQKNKLMKEQKGNREPCLFIITMLRKSRDLP
jgi:hypothetical protein